MSKENNHIDEIFKDAFDGMEANPSENLWDNIADDITEESFDDLFKDALGSGIAQPSERVWDGVKEHLPLNLRLKRSLSSLSVVAGIVVVGMLVIISFSSKNDGKVIPVLEEKETPTYSIDIDIEEMNEDVEEAVITPREEVERGLATDNSIKKKIQSVELNQEEEFVFNVDEEKMKDILKPIVPLPVELAVARVNGNDENHTETEDGVIIPEDLDLVIPQNKELEISPKVIGK